MLVCSTAFSTKFVLFNISYLNKMYIFIDQRDSFSNHFLFPASEQVGHIHVCVSQAYVFNPFQPSVVFHIETSHLFKSEKQMIGFYMKCNIGLKWVNSIFCTGGSRFLDSWWGLILKRRLGLHILHFSFSISVLYHPNIWSFNHF